MTARHADDVTLQNLIDLRKQNEIMLKALVRIAYGPPDEGDPRDLLNQMVDIAQAALPEGTQRSCGSTH